MIVVIADDLTGATEIGGIGLKFGLSSVIISDLREVEESDLLIVNTNTRSKSSRQAVRIVSEVASRLVAGQPRLIYKKIDSVLRGHVMEENESFREALGARRSLIVPANPSLHRTIVNGEYFVNQIPVSQTPFSRNGSESAHVLHLIAPSYRANTTSLRVGQMMDSVNNFIGDVRGEADLMYWAGQMRPDLALSGGAEFFAAILRQLSMQESPKEMVKAVLGRRQLFVHGSEYHDAMQRHGQALFHGLYVANMPVQIFRNPQYSEAELQDWVDMIKTGFEQCEKVLVSINHQRRFPEQDFSHLRGAMARAVRGAVDAQPMEEIFVEGGATSFAVLEGLEVKKLYPLQELSRGVTRMRAQKYPGMHLTMKPGSYHWPEHIWPTTINND